MADPVEFSALSPEEQQQALSAAQGSQPVSGATNLGLQGSVMQDPYAPVIHQPGEGLRAGMAGAQQNIANLPIRAAEAMGAQPGGLGMTAAQGARGLLNFATAPFGTPEGAAVTGVLGPMRAAAQLPGLNRLPSAVAQMGGLGAVGGAAAGLTGGNPLGGAAEGVTAGAVGAAFGKASDMMAQKKEDILNLGKAVVQEVPWFSQLIPQGKKEFQGDIGPLLAIRDPAVGKDLLSRRFWETKQAIFDQIGKDEPLVIPAVDSAGAAGLFKRITGSGGQKIDASTAQFVAQQMQKSGAFTEQTMTMEKAFNELLKQKAIARNAADGAEGWAARERARQLQETINKTVEEKGSPELLAAYKGAMEQYGKGMAIMDVLGKSGVFQLNRTGGQVDLGKLKRYLVENIDEYGPTKFPALYGAADRGAGSLGAADTQRGIRLPGLYGKGMSERAPTMSLNMPTGKLGAPQMGNPAAGIVPGMASIIPPEWLTQQPPLGQTP